MTCGGDAKPAALTVPVTAGSDVSINWASVRRPMFLSCASFTDRRLNSGLTMSDLLSPTSAHAMATAPRQIPPRSTFSRSTRWTFCPAPQRGCRAKLCTRACHTTLPYLRISRRVTLSCDMRSLLSVRRHSFLPTHSQLTRFRR